MGKKEMFGFRIGDEVRIIRKITKEEEDDWRNSWITPDMDNDIGKIFKIKDFSEYSGVSLGNAKNDPENLRWWYPHYVLEKVDPIKLAPIKKVNIKIGREEIEVSETIANILRNK